MTTIAALEGIDYAVLVADSQITEDKDGGFDYLIAFNGNIFRIACDLSFFQANHGAYGIGSGGQLALGYLYSIVKPDMDLAYSKRHARKAVEIASVLDANTNKPLQLVVQERF